MATSTATRGLSRVTIVAPRTRMDLALPSDVPLADLLPTLLRHAGEEMADAGTSHGGWSLSRLGGKPLDGGRTAAQHNIRDGELLYFTPRNSDSLEIVFDDVVDAVATATNQRAGGWQTGTTRGFALIFAATVLLGGAVALLFTGAPHLPSAIAALVIAVGSMVAGAVLSRAAGDSQAGALLATIGIGYATVGGLLLLAGDRALGELGAPHLLVAATAAVVFSALATLAVADRTQFFLSALVLGVLLGLAAVVCLVFDAPAAVGAAVIATVAFAMIPSMPMLSYRLARLPTPSIPTGPEDLKADLETVDGPRVLALGEQANQYFVALLWTVSLVALGTEITLARDGRLPAVLLCAVLALLLMLRARPLIARAQRAPVLLAGTAGLILAGGAVFTAGSLPVRLAGIVGVALLAAAISLVYGLSVAGKRISPIWGRLLDIVEILLIVAVVPLAAWVGGLYGWILNVRP
ncbi:type VII secretion integral membrane protein EccD [Melissospora conviva]|uniref:type VII secretion integral membrane protein EccD n=1 Tax=Melissospora conviva TaxID=3388432 RepID=UPI003B7973DC